MFKKKEAQKPLEVVEPTTISQVIADVPADLPVSIPSPVAVNLSHTAMTIYRPKGSVHWTVAEVKFDPITGATGEFKILNTDTERVVAEERFRIAVVEKVFSQRGE